MPKKTRKNGRIKPLNVIWIIILIAAVAFSYFFKDQIAETFGFDAEAEHLAVHIIDVGNADSVLVTNEGQNMLIDAGENKNAGKIIEYLKEQGVEKIDIVIATHPHADHIGGMKKVIEAFDVGIILMAPMPEGSEPTSATYKNLLEAIKNKGLKITKATVGGKYMLGNAEIELIGPQGDYKDPNNQSIVMKLTYGETKFLFMGDAEAKAESAILAANTNISANFIKIGHHGSKSSSQEKFIEKVKPDIAVMTCGEGNSYGHPSKETVDLLEKMNIKYYRSDLNGNIVVLSDGRSLEVIKEKG